MQDEGNAPGPQNPRAPVPATDDDIREKYLERAIREINSLTRELQACRHCPRGSLMPVLGSGHPQADVFLLKYAPQAAEIEEGVAFYGRAGTALRKSLGRLDIDPLAVLTSSARITLTPYSAALACASIAPDTSLWSVTAIAPRPRSRAVASSTSTGVAQSWLWSVCMCRSTSISLLRVIRRATV